jgi:hypothetical protein
MQSVAAPEFVSTREQEYHDDFPSSGRTRI